MQHLHISHALISVVLRPLLHMLQCSIQEEIMSDSTTNTHARPSALLGIFGRVFTALTANYGAALSYGNLNRFSDDQLSDLGLTRYDLPRAAASDILNR